MYDKDKINKLLISEHEGRLWLYLSLPVAVFLWWAVCCLAVVSHTCCLFHHHLSPQLTCCWCCWALIGFMASNHLPIHPHQSSLGVLWLRSALAWIFIWCRLCYTCIDIYGIVKLWRIWDHFAIPSPRILCPLSSLVSINGSYMVNLLHCFAYMHVFVRSCIHIHELPMGGLFNRIWMVILFMY